MFAKHLTVTLPDGTKKVMKFRGKTQEEAERKLQEAKIKIDLGILVFNAKTPFNKVAKQYFDTYVKATGFNRELLWGLLERNFISRLGNVSIADIKPMQIKQCLNLTDGKSQSYYSKAYTLINGIFKMAAGEGLISTNPMLLISREKRKSGSRRSLTAYEREVFWNVVPKHPRGLIFALMMGCGLRPGEARALTWANIDLNNRTLTVTQSAKKSVSKERGQTIIGAPKTSAGNRTIPMPNELCDMLIKPQNLGYVVHKQNKPLDEHTLRIAWKSFYRLMQIEAGAKIENKKITVYSEKIGQDIAPYYLRHTYATMLCENNVPIKAAQYFMGHTNSKMLMDIYADNSDIMQEQGRQIIAKMQLQTGGSRQKLDTTEESGR